MAEEKSFDEIKKAEKTAQQILDNSEKKKREIIEKAHQDAFQIVSESEKKETAYREKVFSQEEAKIEQEKKELASQIRGETLQLRKNAEPKVQKQADFLFKKFLGEI